MADSRFRDGKADDALRTIGEVSEALGIKTHVLRYWEQQFPMLRPLKRSGGRRYYRPEDIATIDAIDRLVNREGYTLKGAKLALKGAKGEGEAEFSSDAPDTGSGRGQSATDILPELRAIRDRLAKALS